MCCLPAFVESGHNQLRRQLCPSELSPYCVYLSIRTLSLIGRCHIVTLQTRGQTKFAQRSDEGHLTITRSSGRVTQNMLLIIGFSCYCMSVMMRFPARMGPDFNEAKTVPVVTMATQMSYLIALALLQKLEKVKLYVRAIPKVRDYVRC